MMLEDEGNETDEAPNDELGPMAPFPNNADQSFLKECTSIKDAPNKSKKELTSRRASPFALTAQVGGSIAMGGGST